MCDFEKVIFLNELEEEQDNSVNYLSMEHLTQPAIAQALYQDVDMPILWNIGRCKTDCHFLSVTPVCQMCFKTRFRTC